MRSIRYPNELENIVVLGYRSARRVSVTVRPLAAGRYRLLVWPDRLPDPDFLLHVPFEFLGEPPVRAVVDLSHPRSQPFHDWSWAIVRTTEEISELHDLSVAAYGASSIATGSFHLAESEPAEARCIAWSCHMPYETDASGSAVLGDNAR